MTGNVQRVLVTGATGFTGSHLVRCLVRDGHLVRVVTRDANRAVERLPAEVDVLEGDLTSPDVATRAVRGREVVFHLAAAFREAGIPDSRYREVHVDGTRYLLQAASAEGVGRFVHCSTVGVHSHIAQPPADETWPHTPGDVYQATKSEGEKLALAHHVAERLPVAVARPVAIYGPGDLRLLKLFRAIARRRFVMIGSGEVYFHMVHVEDLVRGLQLLAQRDEAVGEVFIFGDTECWTLNEIAARIADICGVPQPKWHVPAWPFFVAGAVCEKVCIPLHLEPPIYRRRVAFFTKSRSFRIDKARRLLGFEPQVSLPHGLQETAAWYRAQGLM